MTSELLNSIDAKELAALAQRVKDYQDRKKLSDNALFRKFPAIGSTTTYKRILAGNLKELDLEKQLANYRSAIALIEAIGEDVQEGEDLLDTLLGPLELKRAFLETSSQASIARFILVEGDTGTGKTATGRTFLKKYPHCIWIEACVAWGDKPKAMLDAFLRAMGVKELPLTTALAQEDCVEKLKAGRRAIIIDEAHHLGPQCLNTIKTLLNRTPGEFILLAMATLWGRLERAAYQEVRQLTGNRLAERIKLNLIETDVEKMLRDRITGLSGEMAKAVATIMPHALKNGNLGFVRNVIRRARDHAEGDPVTLEMFITAVQAEVKKR